MTKPLLLPSLLLLAASLTACADEPQAGTLHVMVYGESFIEAGIPAEELDDGWAITFDRFKVLVTDVRLPPYALLSAGSMELALPSMGEGQLFTSIMMPAGDYDAPAFTVGQIEIDGVATRGAETKRFFWVFDAPTRYDECATTVSIPALGDGHFEITIHADHLFADSAVSETPTLRFDAFAAADADADGEITQAELAATDIGAYDPGSEGGVDDLWAWLLARSRSLGHVDGEGHCHATAVD